MPVALKKFLKAAIIILAVLILVYVAGTLIFGFWAYPEQPLPANCLEAAGAPLPTQMPAPYLVGPDAGPGTWPNADPNVSSETVGGVSSEAGPCPFITVAVLSNGAHTDLLLPALIPFAGAGGRTPLVWPDIFPVPDGLEARAPSLYIYIGWGQREFYLNTPTWEDVRLPLLLRAAVGAKAALHVEYGLAPNLAGFESQYAVLRLTPEEYAALAQYILGYTPRGPGGQALRISAPGYGAFDAFYEAEGSFSLLNTCNTWAARALRAAGQAAPRWTNLAWFVLYHVRQQEKSAP